jgi:hypothetical protein
MLTFHTLFKEAFTGETPEDVIMAVYLDSAPVTGLTFAQWWAYQQRIWSARYGVVVPDLGASGAHARLLEILVKVGALVPGRRPSGAPSMANPPGAQSARLPILDAERPCPNCRQPVSTYAFRCGACGEPLTGIAQPTPQDPS